MFRVTYALKVLLVYYFVAVEYSQILVNGTRYGCIVDHMIVTDTSDVRWAQTSLQERGAERRRAASSARRGRGTVAETEARTTVVQAKKC